VIFVAQVTERHNPDQKYLLKISLADLHGLEPIVAASLLPDLQPLEDSPGLEGGTNEAGQNLAHHQSHLSDSEEY
jgi:hypothetical protein